MRQSVATGKGADLPRLEFGGAATGLHLILRLGAGVDEYAAVQAAAAALVRQALAIKTPLSASSAGLTDILTGLLHQAQGAAETVSFDKRAAKLPGWRLVA